MYGGVGRCHVHEICNVHEFVYRTTPTPDENPLNHFRNTGWAAPRFVGEYPAKIIIDQITSASSIRLNGRGHSSMGVRSLYIVVCDIAFAIHTS